MLKILMVGSMLALSASANAGSSLQIPRVDVDRACRVAAGGPNAVISKALGNPSIIYNKCIDDEQASYDALRGLWPSASEASKSDCLAMIQLDRQVRPYGVLFDCMEPRVEMDELKRPKKFKY